MKNLKYLLFVLLTLGFLQSNAQQGNKEELQRKTQALLREIDQVKRELAEAQKNKVASLGVVRNVEKKMKMRDEIIRNIKGEVYYVEKEIIRTYRDMDTLKTELAAVKDQYTQSVVYAYKSRSNYDFLNFLFSANSFNDALRRLSYLKTYRNYRTRKASDISRVQNELEKKAASLTVKRKEKSDALDLENEQRSELEAERLEKDKVYADFASVEGKLRKSLNNREKERKQIQNAIAAIIKREKDEALRREREEARRLAERAKAEEAARKLAEAGNADPADAGGAATASTGSTAAAKPAAKAVSAPEASNTRRTSSVLENTPEGLVVSQNFEGNRGSLPWPVDRGIITLHYGNNSVDKIVVPSDGITLETAIGAPVKAVFDGEVSSIFSVGNTQVVMIRHGKYFTTYSNLSSANVSRGQTIKTGQVIGNTASNDYGVGEVSFQIDTERSTLNPESWLKRR